MILKEKERFDREAEEHKNLKKLERRRSRVKTPASTERHSTGH